MAIKETYQECIIELSGFLDILVSMHNCIKDSEVWLGDQVKRGNVIID